MSKVQTGMSRFNVLKEKEHMEKSEIRRHSATLRGKFVSRAKYQSVVEENKKLLADIKVLVGEMDSKRIILSAKYRAKFEKEEQFINELKTLLAQSTDMD